ncbi:hypothetical protein [Nocardioides sp. LHG3406-4]|uniref:hypothetical protein n=1 Tax=Nocardioides sp. LHG3406-4 TaxID=2804575 RepID=UPI003CE85EF9
MRHEEDQSVATDDGMGVSSERVGPTGHGHLGTTGVRDTSHTPPPTDAPPEQARGGQEENPDGLAPKADRPTLDPGPGEGDE